MMEKAKIGARLRELREAAGMSREELAEKAGMKIGGVRDIEQGLRMPYFDTICALGDALGVDCTAFTQEPKEQEQPRPGRPRKPKKE